MELKEWQTSVVYWQHDSNLKKQSLPTNDFVERKLCTQLPHYCNFCIK